MTTLAYVVKGRSGEFNEEFEWIVGVSLDSTLGKQTADKLNEVAAQYGALIPENGVTLTVNYAQRKAVQLALEQAGDKTGRAMDTNGVRYSCETAPILG